MTGATLHGESESFQDTLNRVVTAAIDTDVRFKAVVAANGEQANLQPTKEVERRTNGFPLVRPNDDPEAPALQLVARFSVEMDDESRHLRVASSTIGLWVDITGGRKDPRPLVRVEYDRRRVVSDFAAAHVHLHAHSPELAWIFGSSGRAAPDLHRLHFPVGGKRFRPTLEEFLLFLDREKLYKDFKTGWRPAMLASLRQWEQIQASSTARRFPQATADSLEKLGYTVTTPAA